MLREKVRLSAGALVADPVSRCLGSKESPRSLSALAVPPKSQPGRPNLVARTIATHVALIVLSVIFVIPLYWLVSSSLKTDQQLQAYPPVWFPHPLTTEHYRKGLTFIPFTQMLGNTLIVAGLTVLGTVISCSLVAYSLSMMRWKGRDLLFYVLLGTMMLPGLVTMVPLFEQFAKMGWVDTFAPLTVQHLFGYEISIIQMRQFILSIPRELSEAATIDG